jgi:ParB/RepB/Spo0J family partition protein
MKSSDIWNELGNTYFKIGEWDKAIDAYCKSIEHESQSGWSYSNLAAIYVQQGRYLEAIPLYQRSLELFSNLKYRAVIWGRLGNVYQSLNEHGKAIQAFQKADEIMLRRGTDPLELRQPADHLQGETDCDSFAHRTAGTAENLEKNSRPNLEESQLELLASISNQYEDGESGGQGEIEKDAKVWNELGLVLFKVGVYDDAIEAFMKATEINPEFGYYHSNLGQVFVAQGRLNEALEEFEAAIRLLPNHRDKSVCWVRMGDIFRQMGKTEEGAAAYRLSEVLNQDTPMVTNGLRSLSLDQILTTSIPERSLVDIDELVLSVRVHGIIQPLIACPSKNDPEKFTLISGRRRLEAARRAGLDAVPVLIRQASEQEILELFINENIHNTSMNPFELAKGYRQLANDFDLSMEDISARVGRSCHSIANAMKVLDQPMEAAQAVVGNLINQLSEGRRTETVTTTQQTARETATDQASTLWYMEPENTSMTAMEPVAVVVEGGSLLSRARSVLKCNPHSTRLWATSSLRA